MDGWVDGWVDMWRKRKTYQIGHELNPFSIGNRFMSNVLIRVAGKAPFGINRIVQPMKRHNLFPVFQSLFFFPAVRFYIFRKP